MADFSRFQTPRTAQQERGSYFTGWPFGRNQTAVASVYVLPTVGSQSPAPSTSIPPGQIVTFLVSGVSGPFAVTLQYPSGRTEVLWDGASFAPSFSNGSTAGAVAAGKQSFSVARTGGWPESPTFLVPAGGRLG